MTALKAQILLMFLQYRQKTWQTAKPFCKMDKLKTLQWNCRGLNNKVTDLILFSAKKDMHVISLKDINNWKKTNPLNNSIVATQIFNNGHHGSAILVKNSTVIKRREPVENEIDSNGTTLEIVKVAPF